MMASSSWLVDVGRLRPPRSRRLALVIGAALAITSCTSYTGGAILEPYDVATVRGSLGVAGVLRRPTTPEGAAIASEVGTRNVARASGFSAPEEPLSVAELDTLLSPPEVLALKPPSLDAIRTKLGYRYALVGEEGVADVTHIRVWHVGILIPLGLTATVIDVPVKVFQQEGFQHASRGLRLIDLEQGLVLGEGIQVMRGQSDSPYSRGEASSALARLGLDR